MKKLLVVPVLIVAGLAIAAPKKRLLGAAAGGQLGQTGQLPSAVIDPGAPPGANTWIEDGGSGPKAPVARIPLEASAIFIGTTAGGTGIVSAISGQDGGFPQGQIFEEFATVISSGGLVQVNTNRLFSPFDGGVGVANAVCSCTPILCSGNGGCQTTVCDMLTDGGLSQFNFSSDGGIWLIDCKGY